MQGFGTDTAAMTVAAQHIDEARRAVGAELATLRQDLEALRASWRSTAQVQFADVMTRWDAGAQRMTTALDDIGQAVAGSGLAYQATEDREVDHVSAISAALG
jgi:WXG100 family type VII secretion target